MRIPKDARTPENRAAQLITRERTRIRRKYKVNEKKGRKRFPGEIPFKQDMAIILALAGYRHQEIALSIGESRATIGEWMNDPAVAEKFIALSRELPESAKRLLETYSIEAVHTIVDIMRTETDNKIVLEAAKDILDRGGNPKLSRTEAKQFKKQEIEINDEDFLSQIRQLSPEAQEQAAQMVEDLSNYLAEQASGAKNETAETQDNGTDTN